MVLLALFGSDAEPLEIVIFTKQLGVNDGMQRSLPILVLVFVGLSVLLTLAFAGWREWVAREEQVREIQTSLANLASALTQHAEDTIEGADTALAGLVERLETDGTTPAALTRLNRALAPRAAAEPRFRDINILGQDGNRLASSLPDRVKAPTTATASISVIIGMNPTVRRSSAP